MHVQRQDLLQLQIPSSPSHAESGTVWSFLLGCLKEREAWVDFDLINTVAVVFLLYMAAPPVVQW